MRGEASAKKAALSGREAQSDRTEKKVLVLQGGGALGAYQACAYETLSENGLEPDWRSMPPTSRGTAPRTG